MSYKQPDDIGQIVNGPRLNTAYGTRRLAARNNDTNNDNNLNSCTASGRIQPSDIGL